MRFKEKIIFLATLLSFITLSLKYVNYLNERDKKLLNTKYKIITSKTTYTTTNYIKEGEFITFTDEHNRQYEMKSENVKIQLIK